MASDGRGRVLGGLLVATGIAGAGLMMIHPSGDSTTPMISGVHGSLMLIMIVQAAALLAVFSGPDFRNLAASLFYGAGLIAILGAGTLNGFLYPAMRAYPDGAIDRQIFDLIWSANQVLAELGVYGTGIGLAIWSAFLLASGRWALGGFGLIAGLLPALLLAAGQLEMDIHGAILAYGLQASWVIALGLAVVLDRSGRRVSEPST